MDQFQNDQNGQAWNEKSYEAWTHRFGEPAKAAAKIKKDPLKRLNPLESYIGNVKGKKVCNLLGSHGSKAVAMALLGAEATVIDLSEPNERYAKELAEEAGVPLRYVRSDVLALPKEELTGDYDLVLTENGILHYFTDLVPFFTTVHGLLAPGGKFILQDFHPVSTKLITSQGKSQAVRKHKVTGDYFSAELETVDVSYSKFLPELRYATEEERKPYQVAIRKWTIGEIVTALGASGLFITELKEEPHPGDFDHGIPKTFIIEAEKR
ncbi:MULTISPECIES: class I SAM-dependent methyltransferase [Fictibacillus]|uniref:SAM-dependent methyltransferase n=1 Tax=Fictibacillus enclensis TaxID=1017270 RepID=A0A0V8J4B1_9BACL|nr:MULTISPECIES: class I SAM-dependent methyltransferase [Fictibacillus]KSU81785.1 SAM-dependent methyltransferase [Fictibacillus enclensis]RXZ01213.1 class I SAM-dependent methyltransferase [Fictibacillus sp. S7]SCC26084.1 Methyltransferase domain-containing protein [Fictibacillus enclensis]